ncbi:EAL domain-containing response regulator [Thalassospira sp. MA62]|nr:EAL domain-containing response regulator [Thalassospira sp. MA62]
MPFSSPDQINILIIDDEQEMSEFVVNASTALGYHAIGVSDAEDFISTYSTSFDIIVLDLFMPKLDGVEIIRFLHQQRSKASLVLMSGKDKSILHSASELAHERGISVLGSLEKPFNISALSKVLEGYSRPSIGDNGTQDAPSQSATPTEKGLRRGLANREFFLDYQPQFNMQSGRLCGVEALARWQHPTRGLVMPGAFIPLAEESGLINELTEIVLELAMTQIARWHDRDLTMSINVSPSTVVDLDMPERLDAMTKAKNIAPERIVIELTENALMENVGHYMDILTRLRMKKFNLSIDDFGTGYSSMQQLVRLPFNELKIDQSFIRHATTDQECKTVAQIAISLAHALNMHVVAEGIEDEATRDVLIGLNCEIGQGFLFARPMSAENIEKQFFNQT